MELNKALFKPNLKQNITPVPSLVPQKAWINLGESSVENHYNNTKMGDLNCHNRLHRQGYYCFEYRITMELSTFQLKTQNIAFDGTNK